MFEDVEGTICNLKLERKRINTHLPKTSSYGARQLKPAKSDLETNLADFLELAITISNTLAKSAWHVISTNAHLTF